MAEAVNEADVLDELNREAGWMVRFLWLYNLESDEDAPSVHSLPIGWRKEIRRRISGVIRGLTPDERKVVEIRFGGIAGKPRYVVDAASLMNLSPAYVREIASSAWAKLKRPCPEKILKALFEDTRI